MPLAPQAPARMAQRLAILRNSRSWPPRLRGTISPSRPLRRSASKVCAGKAAVWSASSACRAATSTAIRCITSRQDAAGSSTPCFTAFGIMALDLLGHELVNSRNQPAERRECLAGQQAVGELDVEFLLDRQHQLD